MRRHGAPYERGRLVVTALGAGQFTFEVVKLAARKTVGKMIRAGDDRLRACGLQRRGGEPR